MREVCECCGQELPEPTEEDKAFNLLGQMVMGMIVADLFARQPQ